MCLYRLDRGRSWLLDSLGFQGSTKIFVRPGFYKAIQIESRSAFCLNLMKTKSIEPIRWKSGFLEVIDQTLLPATFRYVRLGSVRQVCNAIKTMKVRGAPLIGVVGAYGLVLSLKEIQTKDLRLARNRLRKYADLLIQTRPTGVNLRWAVERVFKRAEQVETVVSLSHALEQEANGIFEGELESA